MSWDDAWNDVKKEGSEHYKTGTIEPIDLMRAIVPHSTLTAVQVFGLCNIIKYATRQLTKGINDKDLGKIVHYAHIVGEG